MRTSFIVVAMLGCAPNALSAQAIIQEEKPRITVSGMGEVKTPPELATIGYIIRGEGTTSDEAIRAMGASGARIEAALRGIDDQAEPQTAEVKLTPVRDDACKDADDDYRPPQLSKGKCAIVGYVATQTVKVETAAVADAGTMVGLVGRGGGFGAHISGFRLRDLRAARRQATAAALEDAAQKASAIAAASRVRLGPIISINGSPQESGDMIVVSGRRVQAFTGEMLAPPVPVRMTPEPIITTNNVIVVYAIGG